MRFCDNASAAAAVAACAKPARRDLRRAFNMQFNGVCMVYGVCVCLCTGISIRDARSLMSEFLPLRQTATATATGANCGRVYSPEFVSFHKGMRAVLGWHSGTVKNFVAVCKRVAFVARIIRSTLSTHAGS